MLQNLKNKLILNFKIIFTLNLIFFTFYILKNYNIELEQFCIMFINLILFKFIILIILQGSISSIQIQTLYNIKKFGKINYKYNDNQIFKNRLKNLKKSKILKINNKNEFKINNKSIIFVYYFFLIFKKIYNVKM